MEGVTLRLIVLLVALGVLVVAIGMCVVRATRGPSHFDRVLAFDCAVLDTVGVVVILSILLGVPWLIDVVLVVTLLGFLSTVALTAYLEETDVD